MYSDEGDQKRRNYSDDNRNRRSRDDYGRRNNERGRGSDQGRYDNRRRDDERDNDHDSRGYRRDRSFDRRRDNRDDFSRNNRRCEHCDRCPTHGTRPREYPSDKFKIVVQDIPSCSNNDISEMCAEKNLNPVFIRITKNQKFAIVEFKDLEEKEEALRKLENSELLGVKVSVREYRSQGSSFDNDREKRRRFDDGVDIYADIDADKQGKGDFDI